MISFCDTSTDIIIYKVCREGGGQIGVWVFHVSNSFSDDITWYFEWWIFVFNLLFFQYVDMQTDPNREEDDVDATSDEKSNEVNMLPLWRVTVHYE